jgi:hypothetical protein
MYQALQNNNEMAEKASILPEMEKAEKHDEHEEGEEHDDHEEGEDHEDEDHEGEEHEDEDHEEHEGEEHGEHEDHDDHAGETTHGFPLVYVMFFGGFMLMLALDQVIFKPALKLFDSVKKN